MKITIIYVNWNSAEDIVGSVASLRAHTVGVDYELVVVDNHSPDGPGPLLSDDGLHLLMNGENRGFGAGCNAGVRISSGEYLLFVNPDTLFLSNVAHELAQFLEANPAVACVGPMVEDEGGAPMLEGGRSRPTLLNEFLQHSTLSFRYPHGLISSRPYLSRWDHKSTRQVDCVLGACMMVRASVFREIGGFDEMFFLYSEELDLCQRIRDAGHEVWYVHTARILHKERKSTIQLFGSLGRIVLQNLQSQHYYFRKHYGQAGALCWRYMIAGLYLLRYLAGRDKLHLEYVKWALKGS